MGLKMNVIFLDIDGVLNSFSGLIKRGGQSLMDIYDEHVEPLVWLIEKTDATVVISSTWRLSYMKDVSPDRMFKEIFSNTLLNRRDMKRRFFGVTPSLRGSCRGEEIFAWVEAHRNSIEEFVILDDDDDMAPFMSHLVQTDNDYGLTYVEAYKALTKMLGEKEAEKRVWKDR